MCAIEAQVASSNEETRHAVSLLAGNNEDLERIFLIWLRKSGSEL